MANAWYKVNDTANSILFTDIDNFTQILSTLPDGDYNITVYANDSAGNLVSTLVNFTVDTTAPSTPPGELTDGGNSCIGCVSDEDTPITPPTEPLDTSDTIEHTTKKDVIAEPTDTVGDVEFGMRSEQSIREKIVEPMSALFGSTLSDCEESFSTKCEECNLFDLNYGWWVLCWYWWVALITVVGIRMIHLCYNTIYIKRFILLNSSDITTPTDFVTKIRDSKELVPSYLREQLPDSILGELDDFDTKNEYSETIIETLIGGINKILKHDSLYDIERFVKISLKDDTLNLIEKSPRGTKRIILNRMLLDDVYPDEIISVRTNLSREWKENLTEISKSKLWVPAIIMLLIPVTGFIGVIAYPFNWVLGLVGVISYMIYLVYKFE